MNKIKTALINLMRGRYGTDLLNRIVTITAFVLAIAGSITQIPVITFLAFFLMGYSVYRMYSKDHVRRAAENQKLQHMLKTGRKSLFILKLQIKEFRTNRHVQCPRCGVIIRTSRERGIRHLTCPKCKTGFEKRIFI